MSTIHKRVEVGVMLDAGLVSAVDAYVAGNPGTDRSSVIDEALRLWHERAEHADWQRVRKSAARRLSAHT